MEGLSRRTDTFTINLRSGATAIAGGGATASAKPHDRQVVVRVIIEIRSSSRSAGWRCAAGGRGLLVLVGAADHIGVRRDPVRVADLVDLLVKVAYKLKLEGVSNTAARGTHATAANGAWCMHRCTHSAG